MPTLKRFCFIFILLALFFYGIALSLVHLVKPTRVDVKENISLDFINDPQKQDQIPNMKKDITP